MAWQVQVLPGPALGMVNLAWETVSRQSARENRW
jgi:hypothetical protein